jgi:hypothetical protein
MQSRIFVRIAFVQTATLLAALCCSSLPAFGQAGENATLPLPPDAPPPGRGIPNFNGVWVLPYTPDLARASKSPLPFTTFGAEAFKNHLGGDDPHGYCQPTGPTRALHSPFPFEIVQTAGMLTFLFEIDHNFRRVFTDGRAHTKDLDLTWYGESVGAYEGDSLTIDTVSLSDRSWLDTAGHQHSDKLHITEKFTKTGPDAFLWTVTYDDPVYFTKPWSVSLTAKREKYDIMEMICMDNNQDMPHYITSRQKK